MYGPERSWAHNSIGYILGSGGSALSTGATAGFRSTAAGVDFFDFQGYGEALLEAAGASAR